MGGLHGGAGFVMVFGVKWIPPPRRLAYWLPLRELMGKSRCVLISCCLIVYLVEGVVMSMYLGYVRAAVHCDDDGGMKVGLERGDASDYREGQVNTLMDGVLALARAEGIGVDVFDPEGYMADVLPMMLAGDVSYDRLPFDIKVLSDWYNRPYLAWFKKGGTKVGSRVAMYRGNVVIYRDVRRGVVGVRKVSPDVGVEGDVFSNRSVWRLFGAMYGASLESRLGVDLFVPMSRRVGMPDEIDERLGGLLKRFEYRGRGGAVDMERRREAKLRAVAAAEVGAVLMLLSKGDRVMLSCLPVDAAGLEKYHARVAADAERVERRSERSVGRRGRVAAI